ncbi:MAG: mechanosensitive ion channel family protein [bacterium]|nr:mechanosensitive ion channel family protein [bacterium]
MDVLETIVTNDYLRFLFIFAGSILLANIVHFFLRKYLRRRTKETKEIVYLKLLSVAVKPMYMLAIVSGLHFALKSLTFLDETAIYWLDNIFYIAFVLVTALLLSNSIRVLLRSWLKKQKQIEKVPQLIDKGITIILFLIAGVIILDNFGVQTSPLLATLGVTGLAVGLALQGTLSNLFAGFHIISDKPIQIGDFIQITPEAAGYVIDIGWRATRIRTLENTIIIIPNKQIAETMITNFTSLSATKLEETIAVINGSISTSTNLKKAEEIILLSAKNVQKQMKTISKSEPELRFLQMKDTSISFRVYIKVKEHKDKMEVSHELIKELKNNFDKEGIKIN